MRLGAAGPQARELIRVSGRAARAYGEGRVAAMRRARRLRANGWTYTEALTSGLLDPEIPDEERMRYLSWHAREHRQHVLNPIRLEAFSEEKLTVSLYAEGAGVPVPATYGTVGREGVWNRVAGRMASDEAAFARMVREDLPEEFVVKPLSGYLGLRVYVLRRDGDTLVDTEGGRRDARALYRELVADPVFDLFLIQERLRNHPEVDALYPSEILQTLRIITLVTVAGDVELLFSSFKLGTGGGGSDNYRDGATGNSRAYVDLETGRMGQLIVPRPDGLGPRRVDGVPGEDRPIAGMPVPLFAESAGLARDAAHLFLPLRTLGWDIGLTTRGPVVVEVNNYWGSPQIPLPADVLDLFFRG